MKPEALRSRLSFALLLGVVSVGVALQGCTRDAPACGAGQLDGCLSACDRGDQAGCRVLGEALAQGQSGRVGTMLLERACLGGDAAACGRLPAASASAPRPSPAASSAPAGSASVEARPCPPLPPLAASAAPGALPALPPLPAETIPPVRELGAHCARGEGSACTRLGEHYEEGIGLAPSPALAAAAYEIGCAHNDALGCRRAGLAWRARGGAGLTQALVLFRRGCLGQDGGSCAALGQAALQGLEPSLNRAYGVGQIKSACANNHAPSCRSLAALLREGNDLPRDEEGAGRAEGRSLDLANQGCQKGEPEACLWLGLWRERPGVKGDDPRESARTTDVASLEGALDAYRRACQGAGQEVCSRHPADSSQRRTCESGLPRGCTRQAEVLDALGRREQADEVRTHLETLCTAGDAPSCAEVLATQPPAQLVARGAALRRACELLLPRACTILGEAALAGGDATEATALLDRACSLGDAQGCEARLRRLQQVAPAQLDEARVQVCTTFGGAACLPLARAVRASGDEACAMRLVDRACREAPSPSPQGCAEAADELRARDAQGAARLDALACPLPAAGPLSEAVARSCGHLALAAHEAGQADTARALAERACEAGSAPSCLVLARILSGHKSTLPRSHELAERACQRGERAGCELRYGPLPPVSSAAPSPLVVPPEPSPLSCQHSPGPAPLAAWAWLALLAPVASLLRRRSS